MTTDHEQARNADRTRRGTNAFIGGFAGAILVAALMSVVSPTGGDLAIVGALIAGLIGAVIGWSIPKTG